MGNINFFTTTAFLSKLLDIWTVRSDERSGERLGLLWVVIPCLYLKDPNAFFLPGSKAPSERSSKYMCRQLEKVFMSRCQGEGGEAASGGGERKRWMHTMIKVSQMRRGKPCLHFPGQDVTKLRMRVRSHENTGVKNSQIPPRLPSPSRQVYSVASYYCVRSGS